MSVINAKAIAPRKEVLTILVSYWGNYAMAQ